MLSLRHVLTAAALLLLMLSCGGSSKQDGSVQPTFAISPAPASLSVVQGNHEPSTITSMIGGSFSSAITLSASGAPSGTVVSFDPGSIPAPGSGSSTMNITVDLNTAPGTYPITVTGNGGGIQQDTTVMLTVTGVSFFTISASPASLYLVQGNKGASTITTKVSGGFNGAIGLSASTAPPGTTVSFDPSSIPAPGSGSSTMAITVGASTASGTYPITVTANGSGIQQNVTVTLTVIEAGSGGVPAGYGWHQLPNTNMASICLGNVLNGMYSDSSMTKTTNYNFDCNQIIPWSGGAADDANRRLIVWGGGHSDYAGNEVSVLNLSGAPSWERVTSPTMPVPYVWDGNNWEGMQPYFVRLADGGQPQPGATPASRHTYNSLQYVPYQNKLYSFGGAVANGGLLSQEVWTLDMGKATWTLLGPPYSRSPGYPTTAYNPNTGHIVMHDKNWKLLDFEPNTGNWTTLTTIYHVDDGTTAAVDPGNNLLVFVGASGTTDNLGYPNVPSSQTVLVFPLIPPYAMQTWSDPSCDLIYRSGGLAWDSALDLMVGYPGGGNQVYLLNTGTQDLVTAFGTVPSHKCLDVPISLNPSPIKGVDYPQDPEGTGKDSNLGINGRFAYFPSLDTFALVNDRTQNAWTLQLTGASPAPGFAVTLSSETLVVRQGEHGSAVISTTVSGGFDNALTLSAAGTPQGVTVSFSPTTIASPGAGKSTMVISVSASTPVGTYPIVISTFGGGDTVNKAVSLIVAVRG